MLHLHSRAILSLAFVAASFSSDNISAQSLTVPLKRTPITLDIEGHNPTITVSGRATLTTVQGGIRVDLNIQSDLKELQQIFAPIVQKKGNTSDRCGDRTTLHTVRLTPSGSSVLVFIAGHFERWHCAGMHVPEIHGFNIKMVYQETLNKLFEQNGSMEAVYEPQIHDSSIRLERSRLDLKADGLLGSLMGDALIGPLIRSAIEEPVRKTLDQGNLEGLVIPPDLRRFGAQLTGIRFVDLGDGRLGAEASATMMIQHQHLEQVRESFSNR